MLRRAWVWGLLAVSGLASAGCSCHLTSVPPVSEDVREACAAVALDSRCHVYLFFLREPDPFDCAGLNGLIDSLENGQHVDPAEIDRALQRAEQPLP